MTKPLKNTFINSTLAFVCAFLITTFIHEFGHFLCYTLLGAHPVLYHNYVQTFDQQLSVGIRIISALAGPVISLIQGIVVGMVGSRKPGNKDSDLFLLWLSLLGFVNFFGYLMLTPLSTTGDTGKVAELLQIPYLFRILIAVAGVAILIVIIVKMGKRFANFIPEENDIVAKRKYVNSILFYPILAGSIINAMLAFPIPVLLSVIYPATSAFVVMSAYGVVLKSQGNINTASIIQKNISRFLIVLTVATILINRLLTFGFG